jgi:uncharacterized protein YggE
MRFTSLRRFSCFSVPVLIAASLSTACGPRHAVVHATVPPTSAPVEGVTVTGFGKASGAPNVARANIGVETRASAADQAMRDANTRVQEVIAALKRLGIPDADLRTQGLSLNFEREEQPPHPLAEGAAPAGAARVAPRPGKEAAPPAPEPASGPRGSYRAANTLEVTIRDLARAGEVLGAASAAGANLMFGLEFDIENRAPLEAQARQKAVEDARARAEGLAQLSGVRLGRVLSITDGSGGQPGPSPMMMMRADAGNVPFERGELTIASSVTVVYALAR